MFSTLHHTIYLDNPALATAKSKGMESVAPHTGHSAGLRRPCLERWQELVLVNTDRGGAVHEARGLYYW